MPISRRILLQRSLLASPVVASNAIVTIGSLAALLEPASLPRISTASAADVSTAPTLIVRADESRAGKPWTIGGEPHVWTKISGKDGGGRLALLELTTLAAAGPPMHIHLSQNESMFLLAGTFGLQYGSERTVLHAGDFFMVPAGIPHSYAVLGDKPARHLNLYDPAIEIEAFFENFDLDHEHGKVQDPAHAALLEEKYHTKVVGPPLKASSFTI
jgi:quercetin dioxygenase-like cupin family protein